MTILKTLEYLFNKKAQTKDILGIEEQQAINKIKQHILDAIYEEENFQKIQNLKMSDFEKFVRILYQNLIRKESDIL